jgi:hypothetical protein
MAKTLKKRAIKWLLDLAINIWRAANKPERTRTKLAVRWKGFRMKFEHETSALAT